MACDLLDVLETAGVGFGFGETVCMNPSVFFLTGLCGAGWGLSVQEGSSMRLMAPLMQAEERWTMNE